MGGAGAAGGAVLHREGCFINKSLTFLEQVQNDDNVQCFWRKAARTHFAEIQKKTKTLILHGTAVGASSTHDFRCWRLFSRSPTYNRCRP